MQNNQQTRTLEMPVTCPVWEESGSALSTTGSSRVLFRRAAAEAATQLRRRERDASTRESGTSPAAASAHGERRATRWRRLDGWRRLGASCRVLAGGSTQAQPQAGATSQ